VKLPLLLTGCVLAATTLAACGSTEDEAPQQEATVTVSSTDDACEVSADTAGSGPVTFKVTNAGTKVTEFYLYGEDGLRVIAEVENIGPGLTRDLVLTAQPGDYITACKPGMTGKGIRAGFTVTDSGKDTGITGVDQATITQALRQYQSYVKDQSAQLVAVTQEFVDAYVAHDDDTARALYPEARTHWEGIEIVAESFGDLDPKMDLREADLEPGQKWTGWHRIEKDLWPPATGYAALTDAERAEYASDLMANTTLLNTRVPDLEYTVDQISNGCKSLLDEIAIGKVTGEEDIWSHTDLWDFQANLDGAKVGYEVLKPLLDIKDKALSGTIAARFTSLQAILDRYQDGEGFVFYDTVGKAERQELSDALSALAEPLSQMTGALTL